MRFGDESSYLRNDVLPVIRVHGWSCHPYRPPSGAPAGMLTYTAGLTEAGLPELAMAGISHEHAAVMLNFLAKMHLQQSFQPGVERVPLPNATELVLVDAPGVLAPITRALYGRRAQFVQLLWPDPQRRYPAEAGYSQADYPQPVYADPLPAYQQPDGDGLVAQWDAAAHARLRP